VVNAQSGVAAVGVPEIIPEGIDALVRVECPQRISPALGDQESISIADFRKAPIVLNQDEVARLLEAAPGLKYKAALSVWRSPCNAR
jgi:hypothetical protein